MIIRVDHQRWRNVIAFAVWPPLPGDQLRIVRLRLIQERLNLIAVGARHQRVDKRLRRHARPDAEGFHGLFKPADQRVEQRSLNINARAGRADLPLVQEAAGHQPFNHPRRVGIFQHDGRVFAAQLQRHAR